MKSRRYKTPFILPIAAFLLTILTGALLLSLDICAAGQRIAFIDSLFTATSAVCVTGLASIDVFTSYNRLGQVLVLILIQLGGIGVITYSTLVFYLLGNRISLRDRMAVKQGLLSDSSFHVGSFIQRMICTVFVLEITGAALIYFQEPERVGLFNAVFLAVSAFCNAGFAPWADSMMQFSGDWGVTSCLMTLIIIGGLGYFVILDIARYMKGKMDKLISPETGPSLKLTFFSRVVLSTTVFLLLGGTISILLAEWRNPAWSALPFGERLLLALFQSVTSRTAGFATADLTSFTDITLLLTMCLMFIGGSPSSCAGGIKTTTFRILWGSIVAQLSRKKQIVVQSKAIEKTVWHNAFLLFCYALLTIVGGTFLLMITENGAHQHNAVTVQFLDIFFEVVSAFGTVGLSINLTPTLTTTGKAILCCIMFIGRLGPIWLITAIQQFQPEESYKYPEVSIPIG